MACWLGNVLLHSRHSKEVRFGLSRARAAGFFLSSFASGHTLEDEHEDDPVPAIQCGGPSFEPMAGDGLLGGDGWIEEHRRPFLIGRGRGQGRVGFVVSEAYVSCEMAMVLHCDNPAEADLPSLLVHV
jgi:hypothetical protein